MIVYIGSDHNGFYLEEKIFAYLKKRGVTVEEISEHVLDPTDDFPILAHRAAIKVVTSDDADPRAILLCGGGQGMAMAANRVRGIRASVIWDAIEAKITRHDNDSNVLCLPSRVLENQEEAVWQNIVDTWLDTPFADAARYIRRNQMLDELA